MPFKRDSITFNKWSIRAKRT